MKRFLSILLFAIFYFVLPIKTDASEDFSSSYDVTYAVLETGGAHASFGIDLTNLISNAYASSYKLSLGFDHIQNVHASDPDGPITPVVEKKQDGYTINLSFNKRVVGKGNTLHFTLSFDTNDVVQKHGNIWEVNIPGISGNNEFSNFNVHVRVPQVLGKPTYIKPQQPTQSLDFTKEQLGKSGISIGFGSYQTYSLNLTYHLKNSNLFPIKTEIALPPTTNYQDIQIDSLYPQPSNVVEDDDGNWLAQYVLKPSEKKDIVVKAKARLLLYPKKQPLSENEKIQYLQEKPYWQVSNPKIKELAQKLKTPKAIYDYAVQNFSYDFSRVTGNKSRVGVVGLLENPTSAVCLEFSDFFVALSRAAGTPAREIDGFAFTENSKQRPLSLLKDVLHAWPEYYDFQKETWVMVDPTWGNTTKGVDYFNVLDFDHIVFTIKGRDSSYPIPAGGYKFAENVNTKDVDVDFTAFFEPTLPKIEVNASFPHTAIAGLPISAVASLRNIGSTVFPSDYLFIESDMLLPKTQQHVLKNLPPYANIKLPISFSKTPFNLDSKVTVSLKLQNQVLSQSIQITPVYLTLWGIGGGVLFGISIIVIFIVASRGRSVRVSR